MEKLEMKVDFIETAKGSRYTYLEDGRTQRFQTSTGELHDPQDVLVFIPNYAWIKHNVKPEHINGFEILGSEAEYEQSLLEYSQDRGSKILLVNQQAKRIRKNSDIAKGDALFLAFCIGTKFDFYLPVTQTPRTGYYTFDTRGYLEDGKELTERHIGNKVSRIVFKEKAKLVA